MNSLYPKGIISFQYADDTLLFLNNDRHDACHLKWLMICFEHLYGMKINYNKNDLITLNMEEEEVAQFSKIFCCKMDSFPFKYLEIPFHFDKLKREDIQFVVDKIINRIPGWKGKLLSYKTRLILLKVYLASIPTYLMPVIKFSKWAIEVINSQMSTFF
jgi:hypothetical protein